MTQSEEPVLSVSNLQKRYKTVEAVRGISFDVKRGEIFGIIGENGCGKTTTIETILGLRTCGGGTVSLFGLNPIGAGSALRKKIFNMTGVQFQETQYQNKIKVCEVCEVTSALYDNPKDYHQLLKEFGLDAKENMYVPQLSGGQRQRLSIVQALIPNPQIVFLDELTTGLDPKARRSIWQYLKNLQANGLTIVLTSHFMDEVEYLCGRIAVMKNGLFEAVGTPQELIARHSTKNLEETFLLYMNGTESPEDEDNE